MRFIALLSQEGSTIETAVEIVLGVVPEPHFLRMHSETFRLRNHPSRHRKERDDAALLTQEGNSRAPAATISLFGEFLSPHYFTMDFQLPMMCSAVRHATA